MKPREFWVNPDRDAATEVFYENGLTEMQIVCCASVEPIDEDSIHVIEYSALKELQKDMEAESDELFRQNKIMREALEFYSERKNFQLIFDDENSSRAEIYEKYSQHSIGDFSFVAAQALAKCGSTEPTAKQEDS